MLNQSIHHEMIGPLKTNVHIAESLMRLLSDNPACLELVQMIGITSKLIMFQAHDMLDQRFLENGMFTPINN